MVHLSHNPDDAEILTFVERWIDMLANDDYKSAFSYVEHDPYYQWTPELIRSVVRGYGLPELDPSGKVFTVTPRISALGGPPQRIVNRENIALGTLAQVWYDLPLNGRWSDLTAAFRIESRDAGSVVILEEIHVF